MTRRVALVTGGSRGIGRASALGLARDGCDVAVHYRSAADEAEAVAGEIRAMGRDAMTVAADVAEAADVATMVDAVVDRWGRIDVLVTSAGIAVIRPVEEITPDEWDRVLAVNLKGTFLCAQRVLPIMKRQQAGRMILLSSQAGLSGGIFIGLHYSASKAGVICITKSLARQLAPFGIRVNCVAPGIVDTDMTAAYPPERLAAAVQGIPVGRLATADEIAGAVRFLASPASEYMTGDTLHVNGGVYMP